MRGVIDWLCNLLWPQPEPLGCADPDAPAGELVPVWIECCEHLADVPDRSAVGWQHWWLQELPGGRFVLVDLPRGDRPVRGWYWLLPGCYCLGVGRGREAIRRRIDVASPECD